ncbi:MAG: transglycosylase SLT domain-containing protein [Candidatus Palauibacterales bacterium]|nr:transglycosylase SLT domain-containing protein [Candidatus Palauibacterales bacterium]
MRQSTSLLHSQTKSVRWPLLGARLAELPIALWGLIVVAAAFALGGVIGAGLPKPVNPAVSYLQHELAASAAEVRDLRGVAELKNVEVEHYRQIHLFSGEFGVPADLATQIYDIALAEGIDPELGFKLIRVESGFRRTVISSMGAIGYTQVKPSTAKWMDSGVQTRDLFETGINLHIGFRYLNYLLEEYNGDTRLALLAYNRGPTRVGRLLSSGIDPANGYAKAVLGE